jgi:hypothetical protein
MHRIVTQLMESSALHPNKAAEGTGWKGARKRTYSNLAASHQEPRYCIGIVIDPTSRRVIQHREDRCKLPHTIESSKTATSLVEGWNSALARSCLAQQEQAEIKLVGIDVESTGTSYTWRVEPRPLHLGIKDMHIPIWLGLRL